MISGFLWLSFGAFAQKPGRLSKSYLRTPEILNAELLFARNRGNREMELLINGLQVYELLEQRKYAEAEAEGLNLISNLSECSGCNTFLWHGFSVNDVFDHLGQLYIELGNNRKAEYFLKEAERRKQNIPLWSPVRLRNTRLQTKFYLQIADWQNAAVYLKKLRRGIRAGLEPGDELRDAYNQYYRGLLLVALNTGDLKLAHKNLKRAQGAYITNDRGILTPSNPKFWDAELHYLTALYFLASNSPHQALKILEHSIDPDAYRVRIHAFYALGKFDEAFVAAKTLLEINLRQVKEEFPILTESEQETFSKKLEADLDTYLSLSMLANHSYQANVFDKLFEYRLVTKGIRLNLLKKVQSSLTSAGIGLGSQVARLQSMKSELSRLQSSAKLVDLRDLNGTKKAARITALKDSIELIDRQVYLNIEAAGGWIQSVTAPEIQNYLKIKPGGVALEFIRFTNQINPTRLKIFDAKKDSTAYLVLGLNGNELRYTFLKNGYELEHRILQRYYNGIKNNLNDSLTYYKYFKPLEQVIGSASRIYLSADGVYNQINLNTLFDGSRFLIDRFNFSQMTNLQELASTKSDNFPDRGRAVFFARPDYLNATDKHLESKQAINRAVTLDEIRQANFDDLVGTEDEVLTAKSMLKNAGWKIDVNLGSLAEERRIKEQINPTVLHIATHGFFLNGIAADPMLESGLILSGINSYTLNDDQDGILTAMEASALTLDSTQLVVLSACETGLGRLSNGEGVYGLPRAFSIAGAKRIIMSLWKVSDEGTSRLMSLFYKNLAYNLSVSESFRNAQILLRAEYPDPYFWGGFVLLGH